jgi:hypothetical protein
LYGSGTALDCTFGTISSPSDGYAPLIDFEGTTVGGAYFSIDSSNQLNYNGWQAYMPNAGDGAMAFLPENIGGLALVHCEFDTNGDLVCLFNGGTTFWLENEDVNMAVTYPDVKAVLGVGPFIPRFSSVFDNEVVYVKAFC